MGKSYYVASLNNLYELGNRRGLDHASLSSPINEVVILFFGAPWYTINNGNITYRVELYDYSTTPSISDIKSAVQNYVQGYLDGSGPNSQSFLTIIVGTNTSYYYVGFGHGNAWGDMIYGSDNEQGLKNWLTSINGNGRASIEGGLDVEPGDFPQWNLPSTAEAWLQGYADDTRQDPNYQSKIRVLYAIGSTGGSCPTDYPYIDPQLQPGVLPGNCDLVHPDPNNLNITYQWTQENVYHLNWDFPLVNEYPNIQPIPQIYTEPTGQDPNGRNSEQWYRVGLYSYLRYNGYKILFNGVVTQVMACAYLGDPPETCSGAKMSRINAYNAFKNELDSDKYGRTTGYWLEWMTDLDYFTNDYFSRH